MSGSYMWCDACECTHESRETCPKGWVRSIFQMAYVPKEQYDKEWSGSELIKNEPPSSPGLLGTKKVDLKS